MDEPISSTGTVTMSQPQQYEGPSVPSPETVPPTAPAPSPDPTIVSSPPDTNTPMAQQADQPMVVPIASDAGNPFIPQTPPEAAVDQLGTDVPMSVPPPSNPMPKRLILILGVLVLLALVGVGIKFLLGFLGAGGSQKVTLNYWGLWENDATMKSVLTAFETAHPNVTVVYTMQSPNQYRERLQAAIDRGDGPDVYRIHNTWVPMFQNELAPAPADIMTAAQFASTFYPVASADLVGGQSIYGMPIMFDGLGLYYNQDLFASAGVTPPATWEDVLNIVPKLTVKNGDTIVTSAIALGTTGNIENFSDIIATMMMQNGAKLSVPTGTQAEQAIVFYRKFSTPTDPVYTWNDSMDNSIVAFASGKVAMILAPSWRVFDVKEANPKLNFKVVPIPQLPGNTVNWASYWVEAVSSKSKNQELAWQLVKYMTSRDVVTQFYTDASKTRLFGEPYARTDLASTLTNDPYVGAYINEAATAKSFPLASRTFDDGINDKLIKYMGDAINAVGQGTAPTQALATAADGFAQVLGSYGLTVTAPTTSP